MKRKALLIGNSNGLSGVQKDLLDFKNFLKSNKGGGWYENEIVLIKKSDLATVRNEINKIKSSSPDYVITFFSGHGAYKRGTILELSDENTINESELFNLAKRQISIFDCCRNRIVAFSNSSISMDSYDLVESNSKRLARLSYEQRIMQSVTQQVRLYSCSIDESSYDTNEGGVYFQNLLKIAKTFDGNTKENRISICHQKAKELTERTYVTNGKQHPDAVLPKCLSPQELILSINC